MIEIKAIALAGMYGVLAVIIVCLAALGVTTLYLAASHMFEALPASAPVIRFVLGVASVVGAITAVLAYLVLTRGREHRDERPPPRPRSRYDTRRLGGSVCGGEFSNCRVGYLGEGEGIVTSGVGCRF